MFPNPSINRQIPINQTSDYLAKLVERSLIISAEVKSKQALDSTASNLAQPSTLKKEKPTPAIGSISVISYPTKKKDSKVSELVIHNTGEYKAIFELTPRKFKDNPASAKHPAQDYVYVLANKRNEPLKVSSRLLFPREESRQLIIFAHDKALFSDHVYKHFHQVDRASIKKLKYPFRCERMLASDFVSWLAENTDGRQQILSLDKLFAPKPSVWTRVSGLLGKTRRTTVNAAKTIWVDRIKPHCTWRNFGIASVAVLSIWFVNSQYIKEQKKPEPAPTPTPPQTPPSRMAQNNEMNSFSFHDSGSIGPDSDKPVKFKFFFCLRNFFSTGEVKVTGISHNFVPNTKQKFTMFFRQVYMVASRILETQAESDYRLATSIRDRKPPAPSKLDIVISQIAKIFGK